MVMNTKLNLPVQKITPTFLSAWDYSKKQWYETYLEKKGRSQSPRTLLGIKIDNAIAETMEQGAPSSPPDNWEQVLEGLVIYDKLQTTVSTVVDIAGQPIKLEATLDTHTEDFRQVADHKTGTSEWTEQRALNSFQTKVICAIIYNEYGFVPEMSYNHLKTKVSGAGAIVRLTGEVSTVTVEVTPDEVEDFLSVELPDLLAELSAVKTVYDQKDKLDVEAMRQYWEIDAQMKQLDKIKKVARKNALSVVTDLNAPYVRGEDFLIYRTTRTTVTPTGKAAAAKYKAAKKALEQEFIDKGLLVEQESQVWTLRQETDD